MFEENEHGVDNKEPEVEMYYDTISNQFTPKDSNNKTKKWPVVLGVISGLICGVVITSLVGVIYLGSLFRVNSTSSSSDEVLESLESGDTNGSKLSTIVSLIETFYYEDVDANKLIDGIYKGVVLGLEDPYSQYYTKKEYDDLMVSLKGNYAGIGALLQKDVKNGGYVSITKVYPGTPAEKAGLKEGDIIISANGVKGVETELDELVQNIRGEEGTTTELVILRGEEELTINCVREQIITPTVEYQMLDNNVGYINVSQFNEGTYEDFVKAYEDLQSQGMTSVIYDMRNNGGGLLDSVVNMLDYILPEGTVVSTKDKNGKEEVFSSDSKHCEAIPTTVLVNGNTASAAEIFTGAIRDFKYGTIIGTNTFGKGIVQSTIPLTDGSAVKLTTDTYYTPSGECIHGKGIAPDIELEYEFMGGEDDEYSVDLDNQIQKALEVLAENK